MEDLVHIAEYKGAGQRAKSKEYRTYLKDKKQRIIVSIEVTWNEPPFRGAGGQKQADA